MKLFLAGALVLTALIGGAWWWPARPPAAPSPATSLVDSWRARSLTLRLDGCVELNTAKGQRAFIYEKKAWRECPKGKGR